MNWLLHDSPSLKAAALGVHSLDHFALTVPDLEVARDFYSAFGLDVRPAGNEIGRAHV